MKLEKDELLKKISESEKIDDDTKISLMEDISDTLAGFDNSKYEEEKKSWQDEKTKLESDLADMKSKYIERFSQSSTSINPVADTSIEENTMQEVNYVDIKEI